MDHAEEGTGRKSEPIDWEGWQDLIKSCPGMTWDAYQQQAAIIESQRAEIERLQGRVAHLIEAIQHCDEWEEHESDCRVSKWELAESSCDCLYNILHAAVKAAEAKGGE